jgi:hypothetical protein
MKYERILFAILVLACLSLLLWPAYYITGDGPSHTFNAKVWFDYLFTPLREFYKNFYQLNKNIEPNWSSHIFLGIATRFLSPQVADKLFQGVYLIGFAYGFRYLIRGIRPDNSFLSFLFFPFAFSLAFQQGFYNYCIALVFFCWTIGYFLRNYQRLTEPVVILTLAFGITATTLSHGMIAVYTMIILALLWIHYRAWPVLKGEWRIGFQEIAMLVLASSSSLVLLTGFIARTGLQTVPHRLDVWHKWKLFFTGTYFQCIRNLEMYPAIAVMVVWMIVFIFFLKEIKNSLRLVWLFIAAVAYLVFAFVTSPHSIGGAGAMDIRLGILPWFFFTLVLACGTYSEKLKQIFVWTAFVVLGAFLFIRFPYVRQSSAVAKDILTCARYIKPKSVVLNLHLNDAHQTMHGRLFERDSSFIHLTDYLGAEQNKPMILIHNYEADVAYFPVQWRTGLSPKFSIPHSIPGNYPPCANYEDYEKQSGIKIDYILFQNVTATRLEEPCITEMLERLELQFKKTYTSPKGWLILFERKP